MAKINISIDDELLKKADKFAKKIYTSRSGLISIALVNYMNNQDVITKLLEEIQEDISEDIHKFENNKNNYDVNTNKLE